MKLIVTESQYDRIIDENILGPLIKRISRAVVKRPGLFVNRQMLKSLYSEISRVIPKQYLVDKTEVRELISRLSALGKDVDLLKVNYIKKYGQGEYDLILKKYLYGNMDNKTFIETLKNVKNPTIKIKPVMGSGADHTIYQSQLYPDKLFKVEKRPGEVNKWLPMFQSHPDVFPKTYNKVKIKSPDGKLLTSVVVEKLDIAPFQKLWGEMENLLFQSQTSIVAHKRSGLEYVTKHINIPSYKKQFNDFLIYSKKQSPQNIKKIEEFYNMVNKLYKITPNPDIRKFNMGYNKNGILKVLDI